MIFMAMVINMAVAGMVGAGIPLLMRKLGYDPAQSSTIFLTALSDLVGFMTLLGLATVFQSRLMS